MGHVRWERPVTATLSCERRLSVIPTWRPSTTCWPRPDPIEDEWTLLSWLILHDLVEPRYLRPRLDWVLYWPAESFYRPFLSLTAQHDPIHAKPASSHASHHITRIIPVHPALVLLLCQHHIYTRPTHRRLVTSRYRACARPSGFLPIHAHVQMHYAYAYVTTCMTSWCTAGLHVCILHDITHWHLYVPSTAQQWWCTAWIPIECPVESCDSWCWPCPSRVPSLRSVQHWMASPSDDDVPFTSLSHHTSICSYHI